MDDKLLDSIFGYVPEKTDKEKIHELSKRADHALHSIIYLLEYIESDFDENTAMDLKKRLMLSIKDRDSKRFRTGLENLTLKGKS